MGKFEYMLLKGRNQSEKSTHCMITIIFLKGKNMEMVKRISVCLELRKREMNGQSADDFNCFLELKYS